MSDASPSAPLVASVVTAAENVVIGGEKSAGLMDTFSSMFTKNKKTIIIGVVVFLLYMAFVKFAKSKNLSTGSIGEHPRKEQIANKANRQNQKQQQDS
jgi:hypothetical protein